MDRKKTKDTQTERQIDRETDRIKDRKTMKLRSLEWTNRGCCSLKKTASNLLIIFLEVMLVQPLCDITFNLVKYSAEKKSIQNKRRNARYNPL